MNQQTAIIELSRKTLERLQDDFWALAPDEAIAVDEALKAMKENDNLIRVNVVPNPSGTYSHETNKLIF